MPGEAFLCIVSRSVMTNRARHDAGRSIVREPRPFRRELASMADPQHPGYPRDLAGYAGRPPNPRWPGGARIAVSVVLNHEEGGEYSILHGDRARRIRADRCWWRTAAAGCPGSSGREHVRLRCPRRFLARSARVAGTGLADHGVRGGHGTRTHAGCGGRNACRRMGRRLPRSALDRLFADVPEAMSSGPTSKPARQPSRRMIGVPSGRLVYRPHEPEHTPARRRARRLFIRLRFLRRRSAALATRVAGRDVLVVPYTLDVNDARTVRGGDLSTAGRLVRLCARCVRGAVGRRSDRRPKCCRSDCTAASSAGRDGSVASSGYWIISRRRPGVWRATRADIARHWIATHPAFVTSRSERGAIFAESDPIECPHHEIRRIRHRLTKPRDLADVVFDVPNGPAAGGKENHIARADLFRHAAEGDRHAAFEDVDRLVEVVAPVKLPAVQSQMPVCAIPSSVVNSNFQRVCGEPSITQSGLIRKVPGLYSMTLC